MSFRLRALWTLSLAFLLSAIPTLAKEGADSPVESAAGWVFRWLNFAIVFAMIVWAFRKLGPLFRNQAEEISAKIAEGARAREAAAEHRRRVEAKLAGLPQEIARARTEAERDAQAETERLRAVAREEAKKIEAAAQDEIAAAARAAKLELKALGARLAVERAAAMLREEITPKAEAALFSDFVAELRRGAN
jgi:F-type H+-transporting ATPase subunit b